MLPWLRESCGNAHSQHELGRAAREAVEHAREQVADLVGAQPEEVVFTSGATEGANWTVHSFDKVAASPFEHSAIREPVLVKGGRFLKNDGWCLHPAEADLVAVMRVNNETGAILDFPEVGAAKTLCDLTQAAGKIPVDASAYDVSILSAHKLYGPKGVGAIVLRDAEPLTPLLRGGGQEHGLRGGTLNVPGIVGFGAAAELAAQRREEDYAHAEACRAAVLETCTAAHVVEHDHQSPFVLSLCFDGLAGETLLVELDRQGFAVSAGPACSSGDVEPSPVLSALKLPFSLLRGAIRVSFGRANDLESCRSLGLCAMRVAEELRNMGLKA